MRRTGAAFFLGDTAFLSDPKFRKLARRLADPDDFNSAVGAYWIALAAARRNGRRELDLDTETGSRFLDDLRAVGLLEADGFPEAPFDMWAPLRPQQSFAGKVRAESGKRGEDGKFLPAYASGASALDALDDAGDPRSVDQRAGPAGPASTQLPSTQLPSTEEGPGETDDLWALYGALTHTIARKPTVLDWLERIETTYGLPASAVALREEHAKDPNPGTLLSRTSARLEVAARKAEKANGEAKHSERVQEDMRRRREEWEKFTGKPLVDEPSVIPGGVS